MKLGARCTGNKPDARDLAWLLRTRRERPRGCGAAEQRDELAALHVDHGASSSRLSQPTMEGATGPLGTPEMF
jgi:hypothetical protein